MNIPYASPNLRLIDCLRAFLISENAANKAIKDYFAQLTGKKHIFITNACRSALYLAYTALENTGEVITSPLTCRAALDPITETGNVPVFSDINLGDLNIQPDDIEHRITDKTVAIQVIHLGGVSCNMERITDIAKRHNLPIIEDCAQSLGASNHGKKTGSFGAISCFSLIKNAYGIGGGILAIDSETIYQNAIKHINKTNTTPLSLSGFRIFRNLLDTRRKNRFFSCVFHLLMLCKGNKKNYTSVKGQLRNISHIEKKITAIQIKRISHLHKKRKINGKKLYNLLVYNLIMHNNEFNPDDSSFSKFYVYNPAIRSKRHLRTMKENGIEAMHLEQKYGSPYQEKMLSRNFILSTGLYNYNQVHDSLISLPLLENMSNQDIESMPEKLKKICQ